jgi:hypothetical protein
VNARLLVCGREQVHVLNVEHDLAPVVGKALDKGGLQLLLACGLGDESPGGGEVFTILRVDLLAARLAVSGSMVS